MLKTLLVENFQSHKSSEIEFVPGVNLICGLSQSGKTALLRALYLVVNNRPLGDSFIREGSTEARVSLIGDVDGQVFSVTRVKSNDDNCYQVMMGDKEAEFRAFGFDVPDKVQELLNLSDVNIQDQLSPYFLVLDPPNQIAMYIRGIAKLDEIDDIIAVLASKIRTTTTDIKGVVVDLKENKKKIDVVEKIDLATLEKNLKVYDGCEQQKTTIVGQIQELSDLLTILTQTEKEFKKIDAIDLNGLAIKYAQCIDFVVKQHGLQLDVFDLNKITEGLGEAEEGLKKVDAVDINTLSIRCDEVVGFVSMHKDLVSDISVLDTIVEGLEEAEAAQIDIPDDMLEQSSALYTEWNKLDDECDELEVLVYDISKVGEAISGIEPGLEESKRVRLELFKLLQECPYCGQKLDDTAKNCLVEKTCSVC